MRTTVHLYSRVKKLRGSRFDSTCSKLAVQGRIMLPSKPIFLFSFDASAPVRGTAVSRMLYSSMGMSRARGGTCTRFHARKNCSCSWKLPEGSGGQVKTGSTAFHLHGLQRSYEGTWQRSAYVPINRSCTAASTQSVQSFTNLALQGSGVKVASKGLRPAAACFQGPKVSKVYVSLEASDTTPASSQSHRFAKSKRWFVVKRVIEAQTTASESSAVRAGVADQDVQ